MIEVPRQEHRFALQLAGHRGGSRRGFLGHIWRAPTTDLIIPRKCRGAIVGKLLVAFISLRVRLALRKLICFRRGANGIAVANSGRGVESLLVRCRENPKGWIANSY